MRHLLRGFAGEVAELLDLDTLHPLPASWVAPDGEQRHGDVAWRASYADGSGRSLVLLIEHQSSVDRDMAVRVLRYELFAYDALRRQDVVDPDRELRLLSVVIHSGTDTWNAAGVATRVVVEGDGVAVRTLRPYLFLDTRRGAQDDLALGNVVAGALWLSGASSSADAVARLGALARAWSSRGDAESADVVLDWLEMLWPRLFPDVDAAALADWRRALLNEEGGMNTLAERVREWEADLLQRGIERGLQQGIERGLGQGIERQHTLLCRQAERKFGPVTARELAARIGDVTDAERLAEVGDWIIDCDAGTALLERVEGTE